VGLSVWGPPHVRRCCAVVVVALYKNQISLIKVIQLVNSLIYIWPAIYSS